MAEGWVLLRGSAARGMPSSCLDGRQGRMYKAVWLFKSLHMIMFTVSWNKLLYFDITMMS